MHNQVELDSSCLALVVSKALLYNMLFSLITIAIARNTRLRRVNSLLIAIQRMLREPTSHVTSPHLITFNQIHEAIYQ